MHWMALLRSLFRCCNQKSKVDSISCKMTARLCIGEAMMLERTTLLLPASAKSQKRLQWCSYKHNCLSSLWKGFIFCFRPSLVSALSLTDHYYFFDPLAQLQSYKPFPAKHEALPQDCHIKRLCKNGSFPKVILPSASMTSMTFVTSLFNIPISQDLSLLSLFSLKPLGFYGFLSVKSC